MVLPKLNSTSSNYQTGRYWQLWSNLPFLIPIPIGNWYSLCSVTASWPTPLEKVWNVSNYKREQRLKSLKIYEFWKSKNLEYLENQNILKILKIKISWKSMNFENLRSIRIMPKGIIMKNCERTTTKTRIQRCKSASSYSYSSCLKRVFLWKIPHILQTLRWWWSNDRRPPWWSTQVHNYR